MISFFVLFALVSLSFVYAPTIVGKFVARYSSTPSSVNTLVNDNTLRGFDAAGAISLQDDLNTLPSSESSSESSSSALATSTSAGEALSSDAYSVLTPLPVLVCPPTPICDAVTSTSAGEADAYSVLTPLPVLVCPPIPICDAVISAPPPPTIDSTNPNGLGGRPKWKAARVLQGQPAPPCSVIKGLSKILDFDKDVINNTLEACQTAALRLPTRCIIGRHREHFDFFTNIVSESQEPFALLRLGDGERMILQGISVPKQSQAFGEDKWSWEGGDSLLARDMSAALRGHYGEAFFFGFASPDDDETGLRWYLEHTEASCEQITYGNLWVNGFYQESKAFLLSLLETQNPRLILAANWEGISRFAPCKGVTVFPTRPDLAAAAAAAAAAEAVGGGGSSRSSTLLKCIALPDDVVNIWQDDVKREATKMAYINAAIDAPHGTIILTSGGPLSKPLINAAWLAHPLNQYVDFGSAMDEVLKGRVTRSYMVNEEVNSKRIDPQWYCNRPQDINWKCGVFGTPEYR